MSKNKIAVAGLVVLFLAALTAPTVTLAEEGADREMRVQFGLLYGMPMDDLSEGGQVTELDNTVGFQASFEIRLSDLIGVEPAISISGHEADVMESGVPDLELGDVDLLTVTGNVNFHLLREKSADFFVGPTVGYALWGDLESDVFSESFSTDDEFIYGFNVGVDVPFGEGKWSFAGALNYLFSELTLEGSSADIGVDPLQLKAGVSYHF